MVCIVLGGGISGLSAAYYLKSFGFKSKIILIEASSRLGGWINSYRTPSGTLYELGPRTLRVSGNEGKNALLLAEELNLQDKIISIPRSHPTATNRLLKVNGKLHLFPNSLKSLIRKTPPFTKPLAWYFMKEPFIAKQVNDDESLYSFFNRRIDAEVASYLIDPFTRGVFAGNAKDLSVNALFADLHRYEQIYGSFVKGYIASFFTSNSKNLMNSEPLHNCDLVQQAQKEKWSVWSFKDGLGTLVDALHSNLLQNGVSILKNTQVKKIIFQGDKLEITTEGDIYKASNVISCLPAFRLKDLVSDLNPYLEKILASIPFVTAGVVNLEYDGNLIERPAFGYLIPSSEPSKVLGVIYDSFVFPQGKKTILTVMVGGYWFNDLFGVNPSREVILNAALEEVSSSLGITEKPITHKVSILKNCIPQYSVGHLEKVSNAKKLLKEEGIPLYLAGNSFEGIGVIHSIYNAKKQAISLVNSR